MLSRRRPADAHFSAIKGPREQGGWQNHVLKRLIPGLGESLQRVLGRPRSSVGVAMFHTGRCGSTVLADLSGQHPDVAWTGEVFEPYMAAEHPEVGGELVRRELGRSRSKARGRYFGFETKYLPQQHLSPGCIGLPLPDYVSLLRELGFEKFVILHRKNYLRRAISAAVGRQTNAWHSTTVASRATRIVLDLTTFKTGATVSTLLDLFAVMDAAYQELNELLSEDEKLIITYEDDIECDPYQAYRKLSFFLGLSEFQPVLKLKKTNPFSYNQMVENWGEVESALCSTGYAWMLDA